MQRFNVHFPRGESIAVYRTDLGKDVIYGSGMFVPVEVLQNFYYAIDQRFAVGQAATILNAAWGAVEAELAFVTDDAYNEFIDKTFKGIRYISAVFETNGVYDRQAAGVYRKVLRELTDEYRSQISESRLRPQEVGIRSGSVGNAQGSNSHGRLTGKIYNRIGGTMLKNQGQNIGVAFPNMDKLKQFQIYRLEEAQSWYMPSGYFIDDVFYPLWEERAIKKALDQKPLPKIPKSLKGKKLVAANRRRSAMKGRNTRVKERKQVTFVKERMTKATKPRKPLEKAWLHVVGEEGEKVEERILGALDVALRSMDERALK